MLQGIFKSKTIWFNVLYGITAVAVVFGYNDFEPSEETVQLVSQGVVALQAIINIGLRFVTKTPLSEKRKLSD